MQNAAYKRVETKTNEFLLSAEGQRSPVFVQTDITIRDGMPVLPHEAPISGHQDANATRLTQPPTHTTRLHCEGAQRPLAND